MRSLLVVGALVVGVFGVTVFGQQQQQQQQQQFDRRDDQFERRNLQYDRREQQAVGRSPYYNPQDAVATITRFENDNNGDGTYQFAYETSNGIAAEEQGFLKNPGTDNEIQTARGSYQYYGPDNVLYKVVYTADENGFQAQGDHLPTPPPIPPEIQKSLDIIYANARAQQTAAGNQPINYQQDQQQRRYQQQQQQQRPQGFFRPPQTNPA